MGCGYWLGCGRKYGNAWVTRIAKNAIQSTDRFLKKRRGEMLVACGHSQILVPEKLGNGVNVGPLHSKPARGGVPEVMEAEVLNADTAANSRKCHADLCRGINLENQIQRIPHVYRFQCRRCQFVYVDNPPIAILGLREHETLMFKINIEPAETQDLRPAHSGAYSHGNDWTKPSGTNSQHCPQFCGLKIPHAASGHFGRLHALRGCKGQQFPLDGKAEKVFQDVEFLLNSVCRNLPHAGGDVTLGINAADGCQSYWKAWGKTLIDDQTFPLIRLGSQPRLLVHKETFRYIRKGIFPRRRKPESLGPFNLHQFRRSQFSRFRERLRIRLAIAPASLHVIPTYPVAVPVLSRENAV